MATRKGPRDGEANRQALLDAAEKLFAEQGVEAVSIRAVNRAAGLAPAAVHYHYGSKDALLEAVLTREGAAVRQRIVDAAEALLAEQGAPTVRELVEIVGRAYLALLDREPVRGARWLTIVAQLAQAGDERMLRSAEPATERLMELVHRAFPDATEAEIGTCWPLAVQSLIVLLARLPEGDADARQAYVGALFDFVVGGLETAMAEAGKRR
jgi:AcrR family transcriptional regulator